MQFGVLSIDLSTKPGWAAFNSAGDLIDYDTVFPDKGVNDFGEYPINYVRFADAVVQGLVQKLSQVGEELGEFEVIIEETNKGKNPYSQKILEFLHYSLVKELDSRGILPKYIRTGVWRKITGSNLNADEKRLNQKISRIKKQSGQKLAKIDGKVVGRRTRKHAALRSFREHFGFELPLKMEDAAEACLLGIAFIKGAPTCDGTLKGGTRSEEE
jgi:hypothetical protein